MYFRFIVLIITAMALAGCSNTPGNARRATKTRDYVVYTGSDVPRPRNELTPFPLSANTPVGSEARRPDSLAPTEPVVGATNNAGPGDNTGPLRETDGPAGSR